MNLAFPTLILLLLLSPGLFFSLSFFNSDKPLNYTPFTHKAAISLFTTLILHILWVSIIHFFDYQFDYKRILLLIAGSSKPELIDSLSQQNIKDFAWYISTMYVFAYILGFASRWLIKKTKADKRVKLFRIDSPWYYLFNGYDWNECTPDLIIITAATEFAGKGYLYNGYLEDYFLKEDGSLDRLVLTDTHRREIDEDHDHSKSEKDEQSFEDRFYPIDGSNFILKYDQIQNLNVEFLEIKSSS